MGKTDDQVQPVSVVPLVPPVPQVTKVNKVPVDKPVPQVSQDNKVFQVLTVPLVPQVKSVPKVQTVPQVTEVHEVSEVCQVPPVPEVVWEVIKVKKNLSDKKFEPFLINCWLQKLQVEALGTNFSASAKPSIFMMLSSPV